MDSKTVDILEMEKSNNYRQNSNSQSIFYPEIDRASIIHYSKNTWKQCNKILYDFSWNGRDKV